MVNPNGPIKTPSSDLQTRVKVQRARVNGANYSSLCPCALHEMVLDIDILKIWLELERGKWAHQIDA